MERCTSTASTTMSFGGVAQRGLGDGREMMDSRRAGDGVNGGVNGRPGKVDASVPTLKMDLWKTVVTASAAGACGAR